MEVAEATGNAEKVLEQIMIERLLDAVTPELRALLKEQKPKSAEELGNLANVHVRSRKGLLVVGNHVFFFFFFCRNQGFKQIKEAKFQKEMSAPELKQGQRSATLLTPTTPNVTKNSRPEIT